jgi:hypothetical protein
MAEHSINMGHCIQLQNTSILGKKIVHRLDHQGSDRDYAPSQKRYSENGFSLSRLWKPLFHTILCSLSL